MTFQVIHQASELVLKGVTWELERARAFIADGDFFNSAQLLRRGNHMLEYPISMLHELETITPYDYHLIRAGLGHGSGLRLPRLPRTAVTSAPDWAKLSSRGWPGST